MARSTQTRRPRGTLSRELILRTALDLVEEVGVDGLSMRTLAETLGTKPMSLYTHVRDKDDLVDGVLGLILDEVPFPEVSTDRWQDALREGLVAYRAALLRRPGAVLLILRRPNDVDPTGAWARGINHGVALLRAAGFEPNEAALALRFVLSLLYGVVLNETTYRVASAAAPLRPIVVPAEEVPDLAAAAREFDEPDWDAFFRYAVDTAIAGLELRLRESSVTEP